VSKAAYILHINWGLGVQDKSLNYRNYRVKSYAVTGNLSSRL